MLTLTTSKLREEDGSFFVPEECKVPFGENSGLYRITDEEKLKAHKFAFEQSSNDSHRPYRSGSSNVRPKSDVYTNIFNGKCSEIAFYNYCKLIGVECSEVDFVQYPRGRWDNTDFKSKSAHGEDIDVQIKSTKSNGNVLFLEKDRFSKTHNCKYDATFLCRYECLDKRDVKSLYNDEEALKKHVLGVNCEVDIVGHIEIDAYNNMVNEDQCIKRGSTFNRIIMDVDNFYMLGKDLKPARKVF